MRTFVSPAGERCLMDDLPPIEDVVNANIQRWGEGDESDVPDEDRDFDHLSADGELHSTAAYERDIARELKQYHIDRFEREDANIRALTELAQRIARERRAMSRVEMLPYMLPRITW